MSLNEEVEALRHIPMFSKIEPSKLKLLAFTSERLTFQDGQLICEQGDVGDSGAACETPRSGERLAVRRKV